MQLPELKKWFAKQKIPQDLQLNEWEYIPNLEFTINTLIANLEANKKNKGYLPYYEKLIEIKEKLTNKNKQNGNIKN